MTGRLIVLAVLVLTSTGICVGQKVVKDKIRSEDKDRSYYLFVPDGVDKSKPAPMLVLLHGSGRNGMSLMDKWTGIAKKEGIILVAPDSSNSASWNVPVDAPDPLHDLIESLKEKYPVDSRRVYLFGHSAGAVVTYYLALMESEYFAAAALHAGSMRPDDGQFIDRAKRKIPIGVWIGTNDSFFPLDTVRATRDMLKSRGMNVTVTEMKGRTHNYYERTDDINQPVWEFLNGHRLEADPKFEQYKRK
jgi:poly(3-hydroxybutyrate) depolymerase